MEKGHYTLIFDFDPIVDDNGVGIGEYKNEEVISKIKEVLNHSFLPDDEIYYILTRTFSDKRKKIKKKSPFFKSLKDIDWNEISFQSEKYLYGTICRKAIVKTKFSNISPEFVFNHIMTTYTHIEVQLANIKKQIIFEFNAWWGLRVLKIKSPDKELIDNIYDNFKSWNVQDKCQVEKEKISRFDINQIVSKNL